MLYIQRYRSPLGEILMAADDAGLVGLWFAGQKHFAPGLTQAREQETPVLAAAGRWLDLYFAGRRPHFIPPPGSWPASWTFEQTTKHIKFGGKSSCCIRLI